MKKVLLSAVTVILAVSANAQVEQVFKAEGVKNVALINCDIDHGSPFQHKDYAVMKSAPIRNSLLKAGGQTSPFTATATYTAKGKDQDSNRAISWTMQVGKLKKDATTTVDAILNLAPAVVSDSNIVECTYTDTEITIQPTLITSVVEKGTEYDLWLASKTTSNGVITLTRDAATGYLTLPTGEGIIIGVFNKGAAFDPSYSSDFAGYWQITLGVKFYGEGQDIPTPAPTVVADGTDNGLLYVGTSKTGYRYNWNYGLLPTFCNFTINNSTSDEATVWEWKANKVSWNDDTEKYDTISTHTGADYDFTIPVTHTGIKDIQVTGWNGENKSSTFYLGKGYAKSESYFLSGFFQSHFTMGDGSKAIITSNNPDNNLKFYKNFGTPDRYSTSMSKIYAYGMKPTKPLYITGIELPLVYFEDKGGFNLTCKLVKCTRSKGDKLVLGDIIAQCDATAEDVEAENAVGITMINFNKFYVKDAEGNKTYPNHFFLEEEFCIVLDGWNNGTFSGVIGSQEKAKGTPTRTWFEKEGEEGTQYKYGDGWPALFIGYKDAAYGYLITENSTNVELPSEGGETSINIKSMLYATDTVSGKPTTHLMVEGDLPEWITYQFENETNNTNDGYSFDLKIIAAATTENRTATVRFYQEGAYIDITVSQAVVTLNSDGLATFSSSNNLSVKTEGVKAYKAAVSGETITLTELEGYIPAGKGVVLSGTANTKVKFEAPASSATAADMEGNALQATTQADGTLATKEANSWALKGEKFLQFTGEAYTANRAYLVHNTGSDASSLRIVFADGDHTTGIESIEANKQTLTFDLSGRRATQRGLQIMNGKAVFVK